MIWRIEVLATDLLLDVDLHPRKLDEAVSPYRPWTSGFLPIFKALGFLEPIFSVMYSNFRHY